MLIRLYLGFLIDVSEGDAGANAIVSVRFYF